MFLFKFHSRRCCNDSDCFQGRTGSHAVFRVPPCNIVSCMHWFTIPKKSHYTGLNTHNSYWYLQAMCQNNARYRSFSVQFLVSWPATVARSFLGGYQLSLQKKKNRLRTSRPPFWIDFSTLNLNSPSLGDCFHPYIFLQSTNPDPEQNPMAITTLQGTLWNLIQEHGFLDSYEGWCCTKNNGGRVHEAVSRRLSNLGDRVARAPCLKFQLNQEAFCAAFCLFHVEKRKGGLDTKL